MCCDEYVVSHATDRLTVCQHINNDTFTLFACMHTADRQLCCRGHPASTDNIIQHTARCCIVSGGD